MLSSDGNRRGRRRFATRFELENEGAMLMRKRALSLCAALALCLTIPPLSMTAAELPEAVDAEEAAIEESADGNAENELREIPRNGAEESAAILADANGTYEVTFDANGGAVSAQSKTVTNGGVYGDLPVPSYANHTFDGWHTSADGGEKITANSPVSLSSDQTLYAHWTFNYSLTFTPESLTVAQTETKVLETTYLSDPSIHVIRFISSAKGVVSATWGERKALSNGVYSRPLSVTGLAPGKITGTVSLVAEDRETVLYSRTIEITVEPSDIAVQALRVTGSSVVAEIAGSATGATAFCAIYDGGGKMTGIRSAPVAGESSCQFDFDGQPFDYAKVFIADGSFRLLCDAKRT